MKRFILAVVLCAATILCAANLYADSPIEGKLTVTISEDRAWLEIIYEIKNLTGNIIPPNPVDTYTISIRSVDTGMEVFTGNLDSAFKKDVSQYASPYAHAVFAVKRIPIPPYMKTHPGFYLAFQVQQFNALGEETVFYIPSNLTNPNPVIRQINAVATAIKTKIDAIAAKLGV